MAKREITSRSSAEDRAQAALELRQAQQEYSQWVTARRSDPTTPREIFEGVDYGPLITANDISRQKRIIAGKYDYVDFGNVELSGPTSSSTDGFTNVSLGGEDFFVPNFGTNPDIISTAGAPGTSLSNIILQNNGNVSGLQDDQFVSSGAAVPDINAQPKTDIGSRLDSVTGNTAITNFDRFPSNTPTSIGTTTFNGPDDGTRGNNNQPTTPIIQNTDDSGSVSGTGIERGTTGPDDGLRGNTGSIGTDSDRPDTSPGTGPGTGTGDTLPASPVVDGAVDVSSLSQPRTSANGAGLYENNVLDLELRPNILHNYANWSYGLSMYMLTPQTYMNIVKNGGVTDPGNELKNLLMQTGGVGRKGVLGERKDYYIDNFRFTSIVGQNSRGARSGNNFDINFDIIEPYGVALLAELVQLALTLGIEDHFEVPYLLEVKFNGYDSAGNPVPNIPGTGPKYIPIKIIDIKFSISSAATVYNVTAVPYNHIPLQDQHDAFIQEAISISGESFEVLMSNFFGYLNASEQRKAAEENRDPDTYEFIIHDNDLRTSKVGFTHITDGSVVDVNRQGMNGETDETIQINANSTIKSAIQAIVGATDFGARFNTTGQPESEQGNENRPLRLIKIIPVVSELGNYNTSSMRYTKKMVFRIETQKMYGFLTPGMPGAGAQQRGWQKEYNWIFTGKNQDIIDFQADYNLQYFNIRNSFVNDRGKVVGTVSNQAQPFQSKNLTRTQAGGNTYNPAIRSASQPITDQVSNSYRGPGHQQANDNMDNVLNNSGADMIAIDLKIIGDPDWIPQDRSILPKGNLGSENSRIVNGSLAVDSYDNFIMLKFKTPRDYDPEKGLMKIDTEQTFVQGLYRLITLESTFAGGKFEQLLKLVRVQDQISNDSSNIPPLTVNPNGGSVTTSNLSTDPDRGVETSNTTKAGTTDNRVSIGQSDFSVPVGENSSSRAVGSTPIIRAGDETNALDVIAEDLNTFGLTATGQNSNN